MSGARLPQNSTTLFDLHVTGSGHDEDRAWMAVRVGRPNNDVSGAIDSKATIILEYSLQGGTRRMCGPPCSPILVCDDEIPCGSHRQSSFAP